MSIITTQESYKNFGNCLKISNGIVELFVTLDFGPRIIRYSFIGGENVFFEDVERKLSNSSEYVKDAYGKDAVWYVYGGHRFWVSPENGYSYYPDSDPVSFSADDNKGISFSYGVQRETGLELIMTVKLCENSSDVAVIHEIINRRGKPVECAPWALSVMDKGGVGIIPFNDNDTGLLSNRNLILWPYTNMSDSRVFWGKNYITLAHDDNAKEPFKIGLDVRTAYLNKGLLFLKTFTHFEDAVYPDNGCSLETYTCADFQEVETIGRLVSLDEGSKTTHIENWSLKNNILNFKGKNEEKISKFVKENI